MIQDNQPIVDEGVPDLISATDLPIRVYQEHRDEEYYFICGYPPIPKAFRDSKKNRQKRTKKCANFIPNPQSDTETTQIVPINALKCGRTTQKKDLLLEDYETGRNAGIEFIKNWG